MEKHSLPCGYFFRGGYRLRLLLAFAFILLSLVLIVNWVHLGHSHSHRSMTLPTKEKMSNMSFRELANIYHNFMNHVTFHCKNIIRAGTVKDGGWNVCVDPEYIPKKPCLVYSFGISWDSSFDLAVHKRFHCEVHSFDPTLNGAQRRRISPLLNFHPIGLSDQNIKMKNRDYKTLYEIRRMLGHLQTELAILKVDIESWEWRSFRHSIPNHMLDDVRQFLVEFHISKTPDWNLYHSSLSLIRDLEELGFKAFSVQRNWNCRFVSKTLITRTACHNIHFVKIM